MPPEYNVRGVEKREEQNAKKFLRDPRSLGQKLGDSLSTPRGLGGVLCIYTLFVIALPALLEIYLILTLATWSLFIRKASRTHLPLRLPKGYPGVDYNDPLPMRRKFWEARGIFFLGNEQGTNKELHLNINDMLTHMLLFGTTGSGKTESLLSLSWNSIAMGSGLIFIDPKGTNKLDIQIWTLARCVGREDDFLLINYSTGNRTIELFTQDRVSNSSNPFAHGTADFLSDIMNSLIPASEGENAIFSERAVALMKTLMMSLVEMRDQKRINLSVRTIREWMTIEKCIEVMNDKALSISNREAMKAYMSSVAGFKMGKSAEQQGDDTLKQFGYAQAYFTRSLSSLTDTYGHVYGSIMGEVDYKDVVFNRRILAVILPSMEKAPPELKALGKVVLAAIRSAMSMGLGNRFEGSYDEMIESLPSNADTPNLVIADEYGYVATEGFAVTAAQARGLGFSCVFAGQDYAGFKRGSEVEAEQILANTKVKIVMALEDAQTTWEVVKAIGAESTVVNTGGFTVGKGSLSGAYRDMMNANIERRNRVDILDLRNQIEGEFHCFLKSDIVRGQTFHADPPIKKAVMRINRMLEIDRPDARTLAMRYGAIGQLDEEIRHFLKSGDSFSPEDLAVSPEISDILAILNNPRVKHQMGRTESGLSAVLNAWMGNSKVDREAPITISELNTTGDDLAENAVSVIEQTTGAEKPVSAGGVWDHSNYLDDDDDDLVLSQTMPDPVSPEPTSPSLDSKEVQSETDKKERVTQEEISTPKETAAAPEAQKAAPLLSPSSSEAMLVVREQLARLGGACAQNNQEITAELQERVKEGLIDYPVDPVPEVTQNNTLSTLRKLDSLRRRSKKETEGI